PTSAPGAPDGLTRGHPLHVVAVEAHADAGPVLGDGLHAVHRLQRLVDQVLVPVTRARRRVAGQREVGQRGEVQVGRAAHAALEHAPAPDGRPERPGDVVDGLRGAEAAHATDLQVDDLAGADGERLARVFRRVDGLVQADG